MTEKRSKSTFGVKQPKKHTTKNHSHFTVFHCAISFTFMRIKRNHVRNVFTIKSVCLMSFFSGERSSLAFERLGSFMSREEVRIQSFLINTVVFQVLSQETGSMPDRPPIWVYLKRVNYGSVDPLLKSNFLLDMIFFSKRLCLS